jgi:hypothetical protein
MWIYCKQKTHNKRFETTQRFKQMGEFLFNKVTPYNRPAMYVTEVPPGSSKWESNASNYINNQQICAESLLIRSQT